MMENIGKEATFFASAARMPADQLEILIQEIIDEPVVHTVLKTIDGFVVLLNTERQILAANRNVLDFFGVDKTELLGKRPGEALSCIHSTKGPGGCGTSRFCAYCGAVLSILASQEKLEPVDGECLITRKVGDSFEAAEFRVRSTPLEIDSVKIWAFVFNDISSAKRKEALERMFIHDIMNLIGGLIGFIEMWEQDSDLFSLGSAGDVSKIVKRLHSEIAGHRVLMEAERGELNVNPIKTTPEKIFSVIKSIFMEHTIARNRTIDIMPPDKECQLIIDESLLLRVLVNMLKNALEATEYQGTVKVWFERANDAAGFFVQNKGVIPENIGRQMFQRSFSTKAETGRGLGTYSMKLIGEKYLKGKIGFTSTEEQGTVFFISLPDEVCSPTDR